MRRAQRSRPASPSRSRRRSPTRARSRRTCLPRTLTFAQAVNEALSEELRRDETVFVVGEDVAEAGTPFKVLAGLVEEFGSQRVLDSPISEAGITGLGVGAAMTGMRPVVVIEDKMDYTVKGEVPDGDDFTIPFGVADVKRTGEDVTVVATSSMVRVALAAAEELEADGISAEVIDPRTLSPLDEGALVRSAEKTGRAIVVDEGHRRYGVAAELASGIADGAFYSLDAPVKRLAALDVPVPFSPPLEDVTVPTAELVAQTARELCGK